MRIWARSTIDGKEEHYWLFVGVIEIRCKDFKEAKKLRDIIKKEA